MAHARNIKPGFFDNEDLCELPPLARLLFAGLWTLADREGRLEDRPKRIRADVLPYDECEVEMLLHALHVRGFIRRYVVAGKRYIDVTKWGLHQRPHHTERPSRLPPCPKDYAPPLDDLGDFTVNSRWSNGQVTTGHVEPPEMTPVKAHHKTPHSNAEQGGPVGSEALSGEAHTELTVSNPLSHAANPPDSLIHRFTDSSKPNGLEKHTSSPHKRSASAADVADVFAYWQQIMSSPRSKLDDKRRSLIVRALSVGYTLDELKSAIRGCSRSPFHMGVNEQQRAYNGLELILRNAEKIDSFRQIDAHPPLAIGNGNGQARMTAQERRNAESARNLREFVSGGRRPDDPLTIDMET
ncbi:hypothetical protein [Burkholderia stagnalis]|uniref:hypothetical protein n=1 Tax=Burkholderia stagnalis TaxID=1503054 RepID=UPI000F7FD980|nr:hypothetical protein [Burkholderia stagnalis]